MRRRNLMTLLAGAAAYPLLAGAQQPMPVIGYLSPGSAESDEIPGRLMAFRRGLGETGYIEGQNAVIEYRWAAGQYDRLPALAADLVARQVTVIVTATSPPAIAAKAATARIPIVFALGIDPVRAGLVASLNRPGSNLTGIVVLTTELAGKRLDLLHELLPAASVFALLLNSNNISDTEQETKSFQETASALGLEAHILRARTPSEIDSAFAKLVELRAGGLIVSGDSLFTNQRDRLVALTARHAVPAVYEFSEVAAAGGLMSYGPDLAEGWRQAGILTGKVLGGTKPTDLPVQQVVRLKLVINLKTAKALGLTIPPLVLARTDEVIE